MRRGEARDRWLMWALINPKVLWSVRLRSCRLANDNAIGHRSQVVLLCWAHNRPDMGDNFLGRVWGIYVHAMRRLDVRSSVHFAGRAILLNSRNSIQTTLWLLWLAMNFFPPFAFFAYCSIYVNKFVKKAHWQVSPLRVHCFPFNLVRWNYWVLWNNCIEQ